MTNLMKPMQNLAGWQPLPLGSAGRFHNGRHTALEKALDLAQVDHVEYDPLVLLHVLDREVEPEPGKKPRGRYSSRPAIHQTPDFFWEVKVCQRQPCLQDDLPHSGVACVRADEEVVLVLRYEVHATNVPCGKRENSVPMCTMPCRLLPISFLPDQSFKGEVGVE